MKIAGIWFTLLIACAVHADPVVFRSLFFDQVKNQFPSITNEELNSLHFTGDTVVQDALSAPSIDEALKRLANTSLAQQAEPVPPLRPAPSPLPRLKPLTIVIVPGLVAEFIETKAFEEIFAAPSIERESFQRKARSVTDPVAFLGKHPSTVEKPLAELLPMGELRVANQTVRVILFATPLSSLESLGEPSSRAAIFNRRLEKYLRITGHQDLAFVGYSRGTVLGLEMLSQAHRAGRRWVADVKGMISLSGVVWGSALADDMLHNPASPMFRILKGLQDVADGLREVPGNAPVSEHFEVVKHNIQLWSSFLTEASAASGPLALSGTNQGLALTRVDPRSSLAIVAKMWRALELHKPVSGYNRSVIRFRHLISEVTEAIKGLTTEARLAWWRSNVLPRNITYYAIPGVMANPEAGSAIEQKFFESRFSYGGKHIDDFLMLQNLIDYKKISGVSLGDAQVSVAQSSFLPATIAALNPANAGVRIKFLGMAGTHHWGIALKEVNHMILHEPNGFPREALLRALAAQVMLDSP